MTTKKHSHYLQFLAQNYHILLLSNKNYPVYDKAQKFFASATQRNLLDDELDNLNNTLLKHKIEVVILDATEDAAQAKRFYHALMSYNSRMVVLTIINKSVNADVLDLIEVSDNIVFEECTYEQLKGRLVQTLSVFYAILSIGRRDISIQSGSANVSALVNFLDLYEGSSLFIVDDLVELNQRLKAGELSRELLDEIGKKCFEIADIFSKHPLTETASSSFKELGDFLIHLELSSITPTALKAFDYLYEIISDLNKNLMDMFVDRIIQDVYVFEHSLENNIEFMKINLFPGDAPDTSELDFFE
jgi:hypothetical protein